MSEHKCGCQNCQHQLCARRVPIFSPLDSDELSRVTNLIIRRQYQKGELIISEGSEPECLIIINSGQVKAFRDTYDGKEQILYVFSEGDFFGEKNLLRNQKATYNVEALIDTHTCMIRKSDFQKLLREHPDIGLKIMEELCSRLDRLENNIESMGTKNVEARVNSVLLEFAKKFGRAHSKGVAVQLPLSREGIANYLGVARETVSRKMSRLQEEGIIEMSGNKKVIILDKQALEKEIE